MDLKDVAFWITAVVSVGSAVMVVAHKNAVRSALFLVLNFLCLALFYLLLDAQLLAVLQILVYAGAIMVFFLFVVMLLNLGGEQTLGDPLPGQKGAAVALGVVLLGVLWFAVSAARSQEREMGQQVTTAMTVDPLVRPVVPPGAEGDQVRVIGGLLMTRYVYPFELTSVLLLVGIIGAVLLSKQRPTDRTVGGDSGRS
jgi:NADH-quinone oxidoreductase subunit J